MDSGDFIQQGGEFTTSFSALHEDIMRTHILTRLDGPTLATASCASSRLHELAAADKLWQRICNRTWPSTVDPVIGRVISAMPAGHRSFYYDSFPALHHRSCSPGISRGAHKLNSQTSGMISAVDVRYRNKLILSKTHETETETGWFLCSPFRVDLLDQKETVSSPAKFHGRGEETLQSELENNLTLSWILIDPRTKRAANFSSLRPVSVTLNWLTADVQARYATVLGSFLFTVLVTCRGKEGGDVLQLKEVSLQVEDMEGRTLSGKESLVILQEAMEGGKKVGKRGDDDDERERYVEFLRRKREMRERKQRRERRLDLVCMATGVTIFVAWVVVLLRRYS
ncbi:probable F-box protein At2g36090 [Rhododendron vialii]|uniref:probable F-box protein At2g36090 n=1 Tax=Rhododendron vialii TaxID=182163 RepID=UPI00266044A7|nr:probable F-box protein At2g36090 [Rhododendron vialii]